jgi:Protein of unknown function (DUF4031)
MAVYVDEAIWQRRGRRFCHLVADSPEELAEFAARLGLRRAWLQTKPGRPWKDHYDLPSWARDEAVRLGAVELGMREMGAHLARHRAAHRQEVAGAAGTKARWPSQPQGPGAT